MWARLQQPCHQPFNPHQSESGFKSHLLADGCELLLRDFVGPFWLHFANLTPTVQTATSEKKKRTKTWWKNLNSSTMDHRLVWAIWEQAADVKTLWDNGALCGDKQGLLDGRRQVLPLHGENEDVCVRKDDVKYLVFFYISDWNASPVQWKVNWDIFKSLFCGLQVKRNKNKQHFQTFLEYQLFWTLTV